MNNLIKMVILLVILTFLLIINIDVNHQVFGEQYENYKVVIDAGHGGYDGGSEGTSTVEKDINLQISIYLRNYLEELGIEVIMIRETDIDFRDGARSHMKRTDLNHRLDIIENSNADLLISIHMNAMPDGRWRGAQTFYYPRTNEDKRLAEAVQQNLKDTLQNTDRDAKSFKSLYILKYSKMPGVIVECGFLSNYEEEQLLKQPKYQEKVAFAIYLGIVEYLSNA